MRNLALHTRDGDGDPAPKLYGEVEVDLARNATYTSTEAGSTATYVDTIKNTPSLRVRRTPWDADVIHGCLCDSYGYVYKVNY